MSTHKCVDQITDETLKYLKEMNAALDEVWSSRGQQPEMIYVPDLGAVRIDSEEGQRYLRLLFAQRQDP